MKSALVPAQTSHLIRLAWEDRASFEEIEERTGLLESQVIAVMRRVLKPASFRLWRKRVSGRITKHRALLERSLKKLQTSDADSDYPRLRIQPSTSATLRSAGRSGG